MAAVWRTPPETAPGPGPAAQDASDDGAVERLDAETARWVVLQLARLHHVAASASAVAERVAGDVAPATLVALLRALPLQVSESDPRRARSARGWRGAATAPRVGDVLWLQPAALGGEAGAAAGTRADTRADTRAEATDAAAAPHDAPAPVIVIAADADRVLLVTPALRTPLVRTRAEMAAAAPRPWLHTEPAPVAAADPDAPPADGARFGWRWFAQALLVHRRLWRDVVLASLALQAFALAVPLATQAVVDKVVVHRTESTLVALAIGLAVVVVASAALTWLRQALVLHTGNRVDAVLASAVFARLIRLPLRFFEHRPTGVLTARLQAVEQVREFLAGAAVTLVLDLPFIFVFLALMAWYSLPLTALVVGVLGVIVGLSLAVVPAYRRRLDAEFQAGARVQAFATEHLAGIETVKTVQMETPVQQRYEALLTQQLQTALATRQLSNSFQVAAGALEQAMTLGILFVGAWLAMTTRDFTIGMLVAFQMFAARLSQPVLRAVGLWQQFQQTRVAVRRLGDIMNLPAEPQSLVVSRETPQRPALALQGLSFRHGEQRPWLFRELSLEIPFGQRVALMGPSGCGKSTLAKLMLGLYAPSEGRILLGGHDIAGLPVNALRRQFGVVPQETVLFSGTVLDNLTLGAPDARFEQVVAACRMAGVHEVIEALPEGYQTMLGERGTGLSGGQRQRLAIARALLKRPQVLIFDEATANLDGETAQALARTINALKGHVTLVFIAHQLPRGLELDQIVRLDALAARSASPAAPPPGASAQEKTP
jgi:subfamily B ATP-binding cassette protein HlyB/CyaB